VEAPLTLLYTARLHGDLAFAPRLFSVVRGLREAAGGAVLLLDLGESCAMGVWHCALTGGRSALFALDAMGYDAAAADALNASSRARMQPGVRCRLLGPGESARLKGVRVFVPPDGGGSPARVNIALVPAGHTAFEAGLLTLAAVDHGQVGRVVLQFGPGGPALHSAEVLDVPPGTPPDPTVSGAVEFILAEADYVLRKAQGKRRE
jgi:hypothetical protein